MNREAVIASLSQITPEWLNQILNEGGAVTQGFVEAIDVDVGWRELSTIVRCYHAA